jgi:hypothetical protein
MIDYNAHRKKYRSQFQEHTEEWVMKLCCPFLTLIMCLFLFVSDSSGQVTPVWQDVPWSEGGLTPTGPVWSLDGFHDFDGDGQGEFYLSSSWGGSFGIDAMLYELQPSGAYQIAWYAWFNQLDLSDSNYSVMTHCDLDGDLVPELAVFLDAPAGRDSLYLFEMDPQTGLFPAVPTTSWDLEVGDGIEEVGSIQANDIDNDGRQELVFYFYAAFPGTAHLMVAQLDEASSLEDPHWQVELDDTETFSFYGYFTKITDLDGDGLKEIVVVEWNYCRMVIYEDNGQGLFETVNDLFLTFEPLAFSNDGAAEVDVDRDGFNELYLATTAGYLWVIKNRGDVSQITFVDSFTLIHDFMSDGGHVPTQLKLREPSDPNTDTETEVRLLLATADVNETQSHLFEIRCAPGDPNQLSHYSITSLYQENPQEDGLFKISKFGIGDSDGDGLQGIVLGSFSLDAGKPHIIVLEESDPTIVADPDTSTDPVDSGSEQQGSKGSKGGR